VIKTMRSRAAVEADESSRVGARMIVSCPAALSETQALNASSVMVAGHVADLNTTVMKVEVEP
jgi:hypothetical protein